MATTVADLASEVRTLCDTTSGRLSDTSLLVMLNHAGGALHGLLAQRFTDLLVKDPPADIDLVAGTGSYEIPDADLYKLLGVDFLTGTNEYRALTEIPFKERNALTSALYTSSASGDPGYYFLHGQKIYLRPVPTASLTGGLRVWYVPEFVKWVQTDIDDANDLHPAFCHESWYRFIVYGAAALSTPRDADEDAAAAWELRQAKVRAEIIQAASQRTPGPKTVAMHRRPQFGPRRT